ncbi:hypothetical protein F4808DRAFT_414966 [Astrocystis sublimbata]|nr:hypothetical protein F4808DRAFT_414966 [Astrocystis sublimbata]
MQLRKTVSAITPLNNPTVRALGNALHRDKENVLAHCSQKGSIQELEVEYDSVVVLQESGSKTPLWLFHPGVGAVFL